MILLLDKPGGITSAACVRRVGYEAQMRAGHAGTLDPGATGLLVLCLGQSRKLVSLLAGHDKRYEARIRLGAATDTLDRWGRVTEEMPVPALDGPCVSRALVSFVGLIRQKVPAYSAVKVEGRALHARTRAGEEPRLPEREVSVLSFELAGIEGNDLEVRVHCGPGTYVRSLAADLARALGTVGHLHEIRRTTVGALRVADASSLEALIDAARAGTLSRLACSPLLALSGHETRQAGADEERALRQGRSLLARDLLVIHEGRSPVVIVDLSGHVIAIAKVEQDRVSPMRVILPEDPVG